MISLDWHHIMSLAAAVFVGTLLGRLVSDWLSGRRK